MAYQYNFAPNPKIADIFNSLKPANAAPFTPVSRTLPDGAGTYQSPVVAQPTAPVVAKTTIPPAPAAPSRVATPTPPAPAALDYSKYTDPTTGQVMTPQQYADSLAQKVTGGSVPNYAGNAATQGPQGTPQLTSTATDLNNQRNDIATGATDPYKAASKSGIAYSPTEMKAIEKAYAGIYDPALKDVFNKLDQKQKEDASALESKNQLALQAQKHLDDLSLKETPTPTERAALSGADAVVGGTYVPGTNSTIDGWVNSINMGKAKLSDITGKQNAALKNAVGVALSQTGSSADNVLDSTKTAINSLNDMVTNDQGFKAAVGFKGLFGSVLGPVSGTPAADFVAKLKQVTSGPVLSNLGLLKGMGRITQKEFDTLQSAITSLSTSESESQFKSDLKTLTDFINKQGTSQNAGAAPINAPDGQQVIITD